MPYIDTYSWFDTKLKPQQGEGYAAFMARCVPAIGELDPTCTPEQAKQMCENAWADYILKNATEVNLTMKRDFHNYSDSVYIEGWFGDWQVAEIHSANMPIINVSYSAVEKAKAVDGGSIRIAKSVEEKQIVFGWANIAKEADGSFPLDWDGDVTQPEELENAAYQFVLKYRATGENHEGEVKGHLIESVMFTKEKQQALGIPDGILPEGWWVGFHVPDKEVFTKIKSGEYEMFSVQGKAQRAPTGQ